MPKEHKFVGYRKYDMTANAADQMYTDGIDYFGGDAQIFLTDLSVPPNERKPVRIACLRRADGGAIFFGMQDTTCYGQLHRSWMPTLQDSDPITLSISALSEEAVDIALEAFRRKRAVQMMILLPDSRFLEGLVKVERFEPNIAIDSVFEYIFTFRRVHEPEIGKGYYSVVYDLRGGTWREGFTPQGMPYYRAGKVPVEIGSNVVPPLQGYTFDEFTAYERLSGKVIPIVNNEIEITGHTVIQANYKVGSAQLKLVPGKKDMSGVVSGKLIDTEYEWPIQTVIQLPQRPPNLEIDQHWEITGWIIGTEHYDFGAPYRLLGDTDIAPDWQEMCIITFKPGTNPDEGVVVPDSVRIRKGEYFTVPPLAIDKADQPSFVAIGWKDDYNVVIQPGQRIKITRDMALEATWAQLYYAKYTLDDAAQKELGGSGNIPVDGSHYRLGQSIIMPELGITREGYEFDGWQPSGSDRVIYPPDTYTIKTSDSKVIEFVAHWVVQP